MKVIVVGCGRMGAELALALAREGKEVTVVDRDPRAFARLGAGFTGTRVEGIGFDRDVLVRAGVERSDALAALTSGDNVNIVTARIARTIFRVPKVVARVYDPRRAEVYARLGLQTVSTTAWGASRVQQLLVHGELNVIRSIGSGGLSIVEHEVPSYWVGRDVGHVSVPGEISVTAILRKEAALLPARETVFQQGDLAVIAVMAHARGRLEHLLGLRQGG
jgi:trk system potassium uptake protein TrkA